MNNNFGPLCLLVANVTEKVAGQKDSTKPYVGLEHMPSSGSSLLGFGVATDSVSTNNVFRAGDTLFGKLRPQLRKSVQVPFDGYCSTDILVLRAVNGAYADFAAKVIQSDIVFREAIRTEEGTKMPRTSWQAIRNVLVFSLQPSEQQKIARILTTLDNLIEKTETLIAKYQAIKQGMMHDLFTRGVDAHGHLRPPQSKAPDLYKQSELGWIPKEWMPCGVDEVGSVQLGRQRSPKHQSGRFTTPYLRVANVFDGFIDYSDVLEMDFTPTEKETYSLLPGDVLLNEGQSLELVGRSAIYTGEPGRFCFQNTLIRFRAYYPNDLRFCRSLFKRYLDTGRFMTIARQTTSVAHLGADRLARMTFPCPHPDEQHRIANILSHHERRCELDRKYKDKLFRLKSGLMQDLLTGKVRVKMDEFKEVADA